MTPAARENYFEKIIFKNILDNLENVGILGTHPNGTRAMTASKQAPIDAQLPHLYDFISARAALAALLAHGVRTHGDAPLGQHLSGGTAQHWPYELRLAIRACHDRAGTAEREFVVARKPRQHEATARAMLRALSAN